jgi:hypothetical protein
MWSELGVGLAEDWRLHQRRYLVEAFVFTAVVVVTAYIHRRSSPPPQAKFLFHRIMADLCEDESRLMKSRTETCREWAARGVEWEVEGGVAEILRLCPYPDDPPAAHSWSEQAAVWERAAERSPRAAERHRLRADWGV